MCKKIINGINSLYYVKNIDEFYSLEEEILDYCKTNFDEVIANLIASKVTEIGNSTVIAKIQGSTTKRNLIKNYMLTTGYDFYGYRIKKYVGIVSGQVVLGTGFASELSASFADFFGSESDAFANKLESAKNAATEKMILKSQKRGGNAIIGVDFDYITFRNNMIGIVANGTSVIIEKATTEQLL